MATLFLGCQITLELDSSIPFKKKSALKQSVIQYGGIVSFIVTKKVCNPLSIFMGVYTVTEPCHSAPIYFIDYTFSCE